MQPTPVLSLRDVVVYPHMVIPLFVGRDRSILALDQSMNIDKRIVLVTQRSAEIDDPTESDLFEVGTLATVLQLLKLPDGTTKVLVEGGERVRIRSLSMRMAILKPGGTCFRSMRPYPAGTRSRHALAGFPV